MSILKKTRENNSVFRSAVPMQNDSTTENKTIDTTDTENNEINGVNSIIESMAEDIVSGNMSIPKKSRIDGLSRTISLTVSPRIEAEWRFHSSNEQRSLASWVRHAVDFYIRKHKL